MGRLGMLELMGAVGTTGIEELGDDDRVLSVTSDGGEALLLGLWNWGKAGAVRREGGKESISGGIAILVKRERERKVVHKEILKIGENGCL
jgi:hypothetical protein